MTSMFMQLWESNAFWTAAWETVYMTGIATVVSYVIGLPLGVVLAVTDEGGIRPIRWLNQLLGIIVNVFRSIPFIVLMVAMLPVAKLVVGSSLGNAAMVVMLIIAASPYIARMVESSIKEVPGGVIEAAQAMGTSNFKIIYKVLIPEAKPSLIVGAVISSVTVLGYSAMASTIGGGGLGAIAITKGHQRFNDDVIWFCVIIIILIVQVIQEVGMRLAHRTDKRVRK